MWRKRKGRCEYSHVDHGEEQIEAVSKNGVTFFLTKISYKKECILLRQASWHGYFLGLMGRSQTPGVFLYSTLLPV